MEPEREIEKLLRAYAQKRRAAAGEPLKLHPATRRLLQDEAGRHATKPDSAATSLSLWQLFRQQWAFLAGFALLVFLGTTLFFPALSASKKKAQSIGALSNLKQIGVAVQTVAGENNGRLPASLDELSNALGTRNVLTDSISGKPFVYVAGGKDLRTLSSNSLLAYSPENKNRRAVLFADGRVALVAGGDFAALTNPMPVDFALADKLERKELAKTSINAPTPAAAPPPVTLAATTTAPAGANELEMQKSGVTATQSFVQAGAPNNQQYLYRNVSASAQTVPVLQSFQVRQDGDEVSVVDRDGSVYQGAIQVAPTAALAAERKEPAPMMPPGRVAAPIQGQANETRSIVNTQPAAQNSFFRVTGMNRTLKQEVVFSGNVEPLPGAATNAQLTSIFAGGGGGGGAGGVVQNNQPVSTNQQQWQLSNSRVVGTAVIDRTNQIEINAVPAN